MFKKILSSVAIATCLTAVGITSAETKVGFVYVGPIGDHGWSYQHDQGRLALEKALDVKTTYVESVKEGIQPPIDVYDAAVWSAITPLSEASIASNSSPQFFPDFTRGRWLTNKPIFAL